MVTDGNPTREVEQTMVEADLSRAAGIKVFVIGIGDDVDMDTLLGIAGGQANHVLTAADFEDLINNINVARDAGCSRGMQFTTYNL